MITVLLVCWSNVKTELKILSFIRNKSGNFGRNIQLTDQQCRVCQMMKEATIKNEFDWQLMSLL